ncbi:MAG: hotdog fold thioesterase [Candidatus Dadabacteria bacterium]|nr:MAG: hotdog fold thioesterase [Candidatus Dadabacteria bacterium]
MDSWELAKKVVDTMLERDAFSRWLGVRLIEVLPGRCTVQMTVREEMLNGFYLAHGGITYSLADSALAFASNTYGNVSVSIETSVSYPTKVKAGDVLTAEAKEITSSRKLGFYTVCVKNQDENEVALFRGTVYKTGKDFFSKDK